MDFRQVPPIYLGCILDCVTLETGFYKCSELFSWEDCEMGKDEAHGTLYGKAVRMSA